MGVRLALAVVVVAFAVAGPAMAQVVRENQVLQPPSQSDNGSRDGAAPEGNGSRGGGAVRDAGPSNSPAAAGPADACLSDRPTVAQCDGAIAAARTDDPQFVDLILTMMQLQNGAGQPAESVRYGDMLASTRAGDDAQLTRCTVRVLSKWDLDAGLQACSAVQRSDAGALEMLGQIHLLAGRWQLAWNDFDAAWRMDEATTALFLRGLAAAGLGRMAEGRKDMAQAEQDGPGTTEAYARDGYTLAAVSAGKPLAPPEAFGPTGQVAAAPAGGARFQPDAPRTVMALNAAGIAACEGEIRALQTESQTWQGTLDEISLRLGMMQRTVYAGRCAGHPQAASLVAEAAQILVTVSPRVAAVRTSAEQTSTPVVDCIEPVPPGDARNPTGAGIFRNTCSFPVYFSYCNVAPKAGSWAEAFACETRANIALDVVAANGFVPAVLGREISHFACRKPALPVATYTPANGLEGYCK